jgi:hypothetical protein
MGGIMLEPLLPPGCGNAAAHAVELGGDQYVSLAAVEVLQGLGQSWALLVLRQEPCVDHDLPLPSRGGRPRHGRRIDAQQTERRRPDLTRRERRPPRSSTGRSVRTTRMPGLLGRGCARRMARTRLLEVAQSPGSA